MICTKCLIDKTVDDFSYRNKLKGTRRSECKTCSKKHANTYYATNTVRRENIKNRRQQHKIEVRQKYIDYIRTQSCALCGENHPATLDFDHIEPLEKRSEISQMVRTGCSWESVWNEINKCRVLCSNCHRKHTAQQNNWLRVLD